MPETDDGEHNEPNDRYRRYLDAAIALGQITAARAEEMLREIASKTGEEREPGHYRVNDMIDRGRRATGNLIDLVRTEVSRQMRDLGLDPEDLARQAADILRHSAGVSRRPSHEAPDERPGAGATSWGAGPAVGSSDRGAVTKKSKKEPSKKAPAKKAPAKRAPAKKAPAKKAPAKNAAAKKVSGKKAGPNVKGAATKGAKKGSAKNGPTGKSAGGRASASQR